MSLLLPEGLITGTATGVTIRIHLQPRASKTELCGLHDNELKVRVTSPPVDDAANKLCIEFFAKMFSLPKSSVTIISGHKSRHKRLHISGTTLKDASDLVAALLCQSGLGCFGYKGEAKSLDEMQTALDNELKRTWNKEQR